MTASIRPCILLVEDDDAVRRSLQLLLVAHGYNVRAYRSGAGLRYDPAAQAAVVMIADLMLPDGDGIDILSDLRAAGWDRPAILISGHLTPELSSRAYQAGYFHVLAKPCEPHLLVKRVDELVGESKPA